MSPYTYLKILDNRDKHMSAAADPRKVRSLLIVAFTVDPAGRRVCAKIDKLKSYVVQGPGFVPQPRKRLAGNLFIELVDGTTGSSPATPAVYPLRSAAAAAVVGTKLTSTVHLAWISSKQWNGVTR